MGFMDGFKANQLGTKAYRTHVNALQMKQQGKYRECMEKLEEAYRLYGEAYKMGFRKSSALTSYGILSMQMGEFRAGARIDAGSGEGQEHERAGSIHAACELRDLPMEDGQAR